MDHEDKPQQDEPNDGAGRQSRPGTPRIFRVAAGLSSWTPEEKAYIKNHLNIIAFHDQLQAALREVLEECEHKGNFQSRVDESKNKEPGNDDDREHGPSLGGR